MSKTIPTGIVRTSILFAAITALAAWRGMGDKWKTLLALRCNQGFGSFVAYTPASGVTIVVLSDADGPSAAELEERL